MCGINGALFYDSDPDQDVLKGIIERCADRGQDSCGVVAWGPEGWRESRCIGGPENLPEHFLPPMTRIIINSNRAEPTTEWVREKTLADVPPFRNERYAVSHNGVIANDKELRATYGLDTASVIDTAILPPLLDKLGVRCAIDVLVGGLALAILDAATETLHLYRNFMPLAFVWSPGLYYFSSEVKNLPQSGIGSLFTLEVLSPFSGVTIERSGRVLRWS